MNVQSKGPSLRPPDRNQLRPDLEARFRKAFDIVLIVAMLVAPFLIVGLHGGDSEQLAATDPAVAQAEQIGMLAP